MILGEIAKARSEKAKLAYAAGKFPHIGNSAKSKLDYAEGPGNLKIRGPPAGAGVPAEVDGVLHQAELAQDLIVAEIHARAEDLDTFVCQVLTLLLELIGVSVPSSWHALRTSDSRRARPR